MSLESNLAKLADAVERLGDLISQRAALVQVVATPQSLPKDTPAVANSSPSPAVAAPAPSAASPWDSAPTTSPQASPSAGNSAALVTPARHASGETPATAEPDKLYKAASDITLKHVAATNRDTTVAMLARYGVTSSKQLKLEQLPAFIAEATALIAAAKLAVVS